MRKAKSVIKEWTELAEGCLLDGPPKSPTHKFYLFINHCRVKKLPSGRLVLERRTDVKFIEERSKAAAERAVKAFIEQPDVRLLRKDLESNDFDQLPKRQLDVPPAVVRGTAEIYQ